MKIAAAVLLAVVVWGLAARLHSMPSDGSDPMPICRKNVKLCI